MESSYSASKSVQNSVAVGTTERGLSPSRLFIFPGKCTPHQGKAEHMHLRLCTVIQIVTFFYLIPKVYIHSNPSPSMCSRHASRAACMARSQYSWCLPFVVANSSKLHLSRNLSSSVSPSGPNASWCSISFRKSSLWAEMSVPVFWSWTRTHL